MRLGQCLLVFREGRPFSSFLVEKVDTHETLAGIVHVYKSDAKVTPLGRQVGSQNPPIGLKSVFLYYFFVIFSSTHFGSENGASK